MNTEGTKQTPPTKEEIIKFYKEQIEVAKVRKELSLLNAEIAEYETRRIEAIAKAAQYTQPAATGEPNLPPGVVEHIVTQEDLDNNPELINEGIKVGDVIGITQNPTLATENAGVKVRGEDTSASLKKEERKLKKVEE